MHWGRRLSVQIGKGLSGDSHSGYCKALKMPRVKALRRFESGISHSMYQPCKEEIGNAAHAGCLKLGFIGHMCMIHVPYHSGQHRCYCGFEWPTFGQVNTKVELF